MQKHSLHVPHVGRRKGVILRETIARGEITVQNHWDHKSSAASSGKLASMCRSQRITTQSRNSHTEKEQSQRAGKGTEDEEMNGLILGMDDLNYLMFTVNQSLHRILGNLWTCPWGAATSSAEGCHSWVALVLSDGLYQYRHPRPVPRTHSACCDPVPPILFPNKLVNKAFEGRFFPRWRDNKNLRQSGFRLRY